MQLLIKGCVAVSKKVGLETHFLKISLSHFAQVVSFYNPPKMRKTGFLMLTESIEKEQCHEMG